MFVSSEAAPYVKTGGLGDVVGSLPAALKRLGHDVRVVIPRYYSIDRSTFDLLPGPLGVPVGFGEVWCGVFEGRLPGDVPIYFLDNEELYGRDGVYGDKTGKDFPDNAARFTVLSRGAFQLSKKLRWIPDVIHAHDWPTSLATVYNNTWERTGDFSRTASMLTIHNLAHQGWFPKEQIVTVQLDWEHFHKSGFEFYDTINFLKAGIKNADIITTVSPTYALEIQTPKYGCMLEGQLRYRADDLFGVLNGMDSDEWSPATDKHIAKTFDIKTMSGKAACKAALQKEAGLPVDASVPVIGIVSRLVDQKGFGDLCGPAHGSLYSILTDMAVQCVILGTGEKWCEDELRSLEAKLPNLKAFISFNNGLAHRIEAGSDFFLMPSKYEPCGLNQMYSLRYGTLPIVRRTGGLADTVENFNEATGEGTGFMFDNLTPRAIYDTVGWAVSTWYNRPDAIKKMRKEAMARRFDTDRSAKRYAQLYVWAIDRRLGFYPRVW